MKRISYFFGFLSILLTMSLRAGGNETLRSPMGINGISPFHYRDSPDIWKTARRRATIEMDIGAVWDRFDMWWGVLQPNQDEWDFSLTDRLFPIYREFGIEPLPILCYGSAWSKGVCPATDEEVKLFGDYVYQSVNRYRAYVRAWQIWNEPNIKPFWTPEPKVEDYARVLRVAYARAKMADDQAIIVSGPTSGLDLAFYRGLHDHGAWDSFDVFSFHPYSFTNAPEVQQLDEIIAVSRSLQEGYGYVRPTWITEIGWRTEGLPWDIQAENILKTYVMALGAGVERLFWFNLTDWSEKWGIMTEREEERKPGTRAYRAISRLAERQFLAGVLDLGEGVYAYVWGRNQPEDRTVLTAWYRGWDENPQKEITLRIAEDWPLLVTNHLGAQLHHGYRIGNRQVRIGLSRTPVIIHGIDPSYEWQAVSPVYQPWRPLNLVQNPGMEKDAAADGPDPWHFGRYGGGWQNGEHEWQRETVRSGNHALRLGPAREAAWESGPIPIRDGERYRAAVYALGEGSAGTIEFKLTFYDGTLWRPLGEENRRISVSDGSDWTRIEVETTAPQHALYARLVCLAQGVEGQVFFDDAELFREDSAEQAR